MPIEKARKDAHQRAWSAYRGIFPDSVDYVKGSKQPNFNVKSNKCAAIVNIGRAYLFGKGVEFSVQPIKGKPGSKPTQKASTAAQAAQDDLDLVWKANHKGTRLRELYNNGAICGHAFIKIIPDGLVYHGRAIPRVVILDSQRTYVECAADDCARVLAYNVEWSVMDATGRPITKRQRFYRVDNDATMAALGSPEQWESITQTRKSNADYITPDPNAGWVNDGPPEPWPYEWSPIEGCQNLVNEAEYYGMPSLTPDIIDLNQDFNLARTSANKVGYLFGFPHRYGRGFEASNIKFTPDGMPILPGDKPEIIMLTATVDLTALRDHAKDIAGDMDEISQTPGVAMGRDEDMGGGKIPAATMELKFAPLLAKTTDQRELYGDLIASVNGHLLELMGHDPAMEVVNIWPQSMLPRDELQDAQAAAIWVNQGVSQQTLMERAEFDPEVEKERKAAEQEEAMDRMMQSQVMMGEQMSQNDNSTAPNASTANSDGSGGQAGDSTSNNGKAGGSGRPPQKRPPNMAMASAG